jgi:hypothetical protein
VINPFAESTNFFAFNISFSLFFFVLFMRSFCFAVYLVEEVTQHITVITPLMYCFLSCIMCFFFLLTDFFQFHTLIPHRIHFNFTFFYLFSLRISDETVECFRDSRISWERGIAEELGLLVKESRRPFVTARSILVDASYNFFIAYLFVCSFFIFFLS